MADTNRAGGAISLPSVVSLACARALRTSCKRACTIGPEICTIGTRKYSIGWRACPMDGVAGAQTWRAAVAAGCGWSPDEGPKMADARQAARQGTAFLGPVPVTVRRSGRRPPGGQRNPRPWAGCPGTPAPEPGQPVPRRSDILATHTLISYSPSKGTTMNIWERGSGGVKMAPTTKMPITA